MIFVAFFFNIYWKCYMQKAILYSYSYSYSLKFADGTLLHSGLNNYCFDLSEVMHNQLFKIILDFF